MSRSRHAGFSLIELMVAVAIVVLLAGMAYPSYMAHVQRGRRADGTQALVELAHVLERYASERGTYAGATLGTTGVYPDTSRNGHYGLAIKSASADGYTITAEPRGVQAGDPCGALQYNHLGERSVVSGRFSAAACW